MENKFCLKSRQELAEIRQTKEEKKNSISENSAGVVSIIKDALQGMKQPISWRPVLGKVEKILKEKNIAVHPDDLQLMVKDEIKKLPYNESKIDEISDTTAMTAYNKRVGNVQRALKNFKTANTKVNKLFKTIDGPEKRPDIEKAMATREKRAEEFDIADKKMAKMHDMYAKRNARKAQSESLTASKALAMSKYILDEISDELANRALEKTVKETVKSNFSDEAVDKEQKMIKQMILRKKRQGKELDQNEKEFLAKSESKINENDNVKDTMEKLYHFIQIEREMHNAGEWGKDEAKDKAHKQSISDLFDELDKLGVGFGVQNSLIASAQSSNPDFSKWYAENVAKSESVNEELQVGDTARYNGHVWVKVKSIEGNKALVSPIHQEDIEKGNFGEEEFVMLDDLEKQPKLRESKINENETILETIKENIMNAIKERYGDDPDTLDWIYVDVERREDGYVRVELRAELDYEGMNNLTDYLNPVIKKYDKQAYFDMDSPGVAEAILEVEGIEESLNEDWKEHDYQYLSVKQALEDIEDEYSREKYLKDFEGLIKRLEYSTNIDKSESLNEELAPEYTQEAYDKIEDIANDKLKELVREHQDDDPEVDNIVGELVMEYIKSIPSDDILHMYLEMGFDEPQLVKPFRPLVEDELIRYFNNKLDRWKEYAYDVVAYEQDESLNAKSALGKSKKILEGMIDKYGREVDPKEWEEKEAKGLNEEYGPLQGEPYMEEIAHDLEIGSTYRETDEYSWSLLVEGMEVEELIESNEVLEWLLQEISYPVRDGHDYYNGLNLLLDKDRFDYENGLIAHDLERLGFDTRLFEDTDEIKTWINYDLNLKVSEDDEEEEIEESKINEVSDELVDKAQNKALADVVNPGDKEKKTKGFKHLLSLEKLKQLRDKRKANKEDLK